MENAPLTTAEKRSVLALDAALRPRLDAEALRAASAASQAAHGERHQHVKLVALKCSARQIANWKAEVEGMNIYVVHPPTSKGTYAEQFGWTVTTPTGWTAYSGDRKGATAYARAMNEQTAREGRDA